MSTYPFLLLSIACAFSALCVAADETRSGEFPDRLISTPERDEFFGGTGEDVFVIEELGKGPDLILDFEPEADRLELTPAFLTGLNLETDDFELSHKGVLSIKLDHRTIPVVDLKLSGMTFEINQRKGSYLLKFQRTIGHPRQ